MVAPNDGVRDSVPMPWLFEAAAVLASEDVEGMYTDASTISQSLSNAADLFGLPAVSVSFDPTVEAEAVGCTCPEGPGSASVTGFVDSPDAAFDVDLSSVVDSGRVPTFLDACERLSATVSDAMVLGGVTGPSALATALLADEPAAHDDETLEETLFTATDVSLELINAYLDAGADGILLLEPDGVGTYDDYVDVATPIVNVLDHYETTGIVATREATRTDIERIGALGFDALTGGVDDPGSATRTADEHDLPLGVGIPAETLLDGIDAVDGFLDGVPDEALVSTAWTVPPGVDPDVLHHLLGSLE